MALPETFFRSLRLDPGSGSESDSDRPLTEEEKAHSLYQQGLSCHHCYESLNDEQKSRFAERQKQITLAKARGEEHIGNAAQEATERRRAEKKARKKRAAEAQ